MGSEHQFKRELSQLIRKYSTGLQTSEFAEYLGEYHHDLADGSLSPSVEVVNEVEPVRLRVTYSSGVGLERDLDDYLKVGGVCLEVDQALPPLSDVLLTIAGVHLPQTVTLRGRVVRETPAGVAFQVNAPEEPIAQSLREMPEKMRKAAAEAGKRALEQAAKAAELADQAASARSEPAQPTQSRPQPGPAASRPEARQACAPIEIAGEPVSSWDLSRTSVPTILLGLLDREGLGVLDLDLGERRAQVVLDGANVVDVEIYPPAKKESLESLLEAAGKLDDEQIANARQYSERHGVAMAEALVDLDILSYAQMGLALKTRARFLLGIVWGKSEGRAQLYDTDEIARRFRAPQSSLAYHLFRRMRDRFRRADADWYEERREFFRAHLVSRAAEPRCALADLDIGKKDTRFYNVVLDTPRPLSELLRISQLGDQEMLALLECLRLLGMLRVEEANPWTRKRTKFVKQVERMKARLHAKNHFEVLGVHWTAYDEEVEEAYEERMAGLADEKLPEDLEQSTLEIVEDLRQKLTEAYELLSDRRRRADYRTEVADSFDRKGALEMFLKQADTAKLRRDISGAIDAYRRVLEIKPNHPQAKQDMVVLQKLKAAEKR